VFAHPHVRSQRVCAAVSEDGNIKRTLVVSTDLPSSGADFDQLVTAIVGYLKKQDDLDSAEIECFVTVNSGAVAVQSRLKSACNDDGPIIGPLSY
jgi:hypothetical protein